MLQEEVIRLQVQSIIDQLLDYKTNIEVLDAGCGSASHFKFGQGAYLVGIDISQQQLDKNTALNKRILGDLQSYNLPSQNFDVIVSWYVLEHLSQPEKALKNFLQAIKEDGIIILGIPNVMSLWGLITKYTPLWFHIWVYKYIFGEKKAATPDFPGTFQTFSRFSITPTSIKQFALANGLMIQYFILYENCRQKGVREQHPILIPAWKLLELMTKAISFGKVNVDLTNCVLVLKKQKVCIAHP